MSIESDVVCLVPYFWPPHFSGSLSELDGPLLAALGVSLHRVPLCALTAVSVQWFHMWVLIRFFFTLELGFMSLRSLFTHKLWLKPYLLLFSLWEMSLGKLVKPLIHSSGSPLNCLHCWKRLWKSSFWQASIVMKGKKKILVLGSVTHF